MFQATIRRNPIDILTVDTFLKWMGEPNHFVPGANRYIGAGQFCFALPNGRIFPIGIPIVTMDPRFDGRYSSVVNPLEISRMTANTGEENYSVNLKAELEAKELIVHTGEEFKFFSLSFAEFPDDRGLNGLKLTNLAAHMSNPQSLLAIEGNQKDPATIDPRDPQNSGSAYEYTKPFENLAHLFYPNEQAVVGEAGSGETDPLNIMIGSIGVTYESWVQLIAI